MLPMPAARLSQESRKIPAERSKKASRIPLVTVCPRALNCAMDLDRKPGIAGQTDNVRNSKRGGARHSDFGFRLSAFFRISDFGLRIFPLLLLIGCSNEPSGSASQSPSTPAAYGQPAGAPSSAIPRARAMAADLAWTNAPFYCLQTELSPATLYHCASNYLGLFTQMAEDGLGAPSHAAFITHSGPRPFKNGQRLTAAEMDECWILVWFAGAKGWTNWDSPWAVFLQKKPVSMELNDTGLHLRFRHGAGDVVLLPLYGYLKPPLEGKDWLAAHGLPSKKIATWKWADFLTREPLTRVRYWASALREFPIYCEDSFSVDRSKESVTIRQRFQWHSIPDEWQTPHLKLAPLSPPLAQASMDEAFPVTFSRRVMNLDLFTPYGPCMGIEGVDQYDATFKVLRYIHETEIPELPSTNAPAVVQAALERLRQTSRQKFRAPDKYEYDHGGLGNFCWAIMGDLWYAKALPYYDPATRTNALASLRKYFHEDVLVTNRFKLREFPKDSGRAYYILEGPGIGSWGVLGDAGKFSANLLETLWAYAHFTGDWDLLKERWDLVKKLFVTPAETRWAGFGRDAIAELGDEAAPCLAMARLAYKVGDLDTYNYACYMFARELTHHWLKQRGAPYFRRHQPWHTMEAMDEEVYLTNLWGDTAAWQIDGPRYPAKTGERQFNNRWVRFKNEDVARFYRDFLQEDVRLELDRLSARWDPKRRYQNDSHIMPSLVQLRSLLLNEPPDQLAKIAAPDQFSGPASGVIASCLSLLRTSHPIRYQRLIPPGPPSPFVAGLEREVAGPNPYLLQSVQFSDENKKAVTRQLTWPRPAWWQSWRTPAGRRWNFGQVRPVREGNPPAARVAPVNWNTQVILFEMP